MQIPIENIYYLLCYAWNKLEEKNRVSVDATDYNSLPDLFAKVLLNGTRILLKRGIDKNYQGITEEVIGIKGKLEFSSTIKGNLMSKGKTICTFDEFSMNILMNRILITTLLQLRKTKGLDNKLRNEIRKTELMLEGIEPITIERKLFRQIKLNRNNRFYGFIMHVCELIHENLLVTEEPGKYQFADFIRDEKQMNQLFEAFIRNFYRLEQNFYQQVGSEMIDWKFERLDENTPEHLPKMKTDISLESDQHKIIIDAKYYRETMTTNYDKEKIRSAHLYQLFSYLINQEAGDDRSRRATGILLYPTIDQEYNLHYRYRDHAIQVKTINLNTDWRSISVRLLEIIDIKKYI
ncbi:5-methylcytosine-specific restriction endonuclease system specificity protein McrC [Flavihumibacter sediminis]|nr:5-methylcytosine-specific restriction endonuclease system specificity protein McrC [Flavihumibacter sediminis]